MGTLRVDLLGPLAVRVDEVVVPITSARQAALLACLALNAPRLVEVDAIIGALWGDEPPGRPEQAVQQYVSSLRSSLEPARAARHPAALLVTESVGYRLAPSSTDVAETERDVILVEQLTGAQQWSDALVTIDVVLGRWRGSALAGMPDTELFNEHRRALDEVRTATRERRLRVMLALGMTDRVVVDAESLVAAAPTREGAWATLVQALYVSGRVVDAFAAYERVATVLDDELSLPPGRELRELYARMVRRDPTLIVAAASDELARTFRAEDHGDLPWLEFGDGQRVVLAAGVSTLGRRPTHAVVLQDTRVSRDHAELRHTDGDVTVRDLGSSNGTFVNGVPLPPGTSRSLAPGDLLSIGGLTLRFHRQV